MNWRALLRRRHLVREFDASPQSVNIDAAIASWVVDVESARAGRFRRHVRNAVTVVCAVLALLIGFVAYASQTPSLRSRFLSAFLGYHDPSIFNHASQFEIARVLDSYGSLIAETRLAEEIRGTTASLDMLVNNAQYIRIAQKENLLALVRSGKRLRLILWDYGEDNRVGYDALHVATGKLPEEAREGARNVHNELRDWKAVIAQDKSIRGTMEFRWNRKPLFYTMWIRDWGTPDAIGHLSIHFYRGQEYFPSFRVSMRDGTRMLKNMHDEFELAWRDARVID